MRLAEIQKDWDYRKRLFLAKIFIFLVGASILVILCAVFAGSAEAVFYPTSAIVVSDDPAGGDCGLIGVWTDTAENPKTCMLTQDIYSTVTGGTIIIEADGITLDGNGHTISAPGGNSIGVYLNGRTGVTVKNLTIDNFLTAMRVRYSHGNTFTDNTFMSSNNGSGIHVDNSDSNVITGNVFYSNNVYGLYIAGSANMAYNNSFFGNSVQAIIVSGAGNTFNEPAPSGGNYWEDYDEPAEGCYDSDIDGFCDDPYFFSGGQDERPWVSPGGWDETSTLIVSNVKPAGSQSTDELTISAGYISTGAGIDTSSVIVTLDGEPLSGCTVNMTGVSCPVAGLLMGQHNIGGSVSNLAGDTAAISGSFTVNRMIIRDNATGGNCASLGTWDAVAKTCELTRGYDIYTYGGPALITIADDNITLDGGGQMIRSLVLGSYPGIYMKGRTGVTVRNLTTDNLSVAMIVESSHGNVFTDNTLRSYISGGGIRLTNSNWNTISHNVFSFTSKMGRFGGVPLSIAGSDNTVFNNNFIGNTAHVTVVSGSGNNFSEPAPGGGNYWEDYDEPGEGCNDNDSDGICDDPYLFNGGQDDRPWVTPGGWDDIEPDPSVSLEQLLDFYDQSIASGDLSGAGPGRSAQGRLKATRNMIEAAGALVAADKYPEAIDQLKGVADRCDGVDKPPDFVSGTASAELNGRVNEIIFILESMEQP